MTGNNDLSGRIEIDRRYDPVLRRRHFLANTIDGLIVQANNGGHRPLADRHSRLHKGSALPYQVHRIGKRQGARTNQGRKFPEAVPGHDLWHRAALLLPALAPLFDQFRAGGGDPEVLVPVFGVEPAYLNVALETMSGQYGSIEGYFNDGLGLDDQTLDVLRTALTEFPD